jgi:hypothetical protein
MTDPDFALQRERMAATGIGFAGIEGVWWLPATQPFTLPQVLSGDLKHIGAAIFALFDAVTGLYGTPAGVGSGLAELLNHKVPAHIPRLMLPGRVDSLRPDFQLVVTPPSPDQPNNILRNTQYAVASSLSSPSPSSLYGLAATELEICPSAHGFTHAMQVGYGLPTDLVDSFVQYLAGRELLIAGASQWSEFIPEQLAFCRALAEAGGRGRVLYDLPIATLTRQIQHGERWQPPMFGIKTKPAQWQNDLLGFMQRHNLLQCIYPDERWPQHVGDAVVFRFGYFDCFSQNKLHYFEQWQRSGATLLNPAMFILDSKVIMAALALPVVRERIVALNPAALPWLDRVIPPTLLLLPEHLPQLLAEQAAWIIKYAGFDGGNQAWGGRSLHVGLNYSAAQWQQLLTQALELPWPIVAQRLTPSARLDIEYFDPNGQVRQLHQGTTRLRTFFLRTGGQAIACGSHLTVSGGTMQVSEATDSVQAPVRFAG